MGIRFSLAAVFGLILAAYFGVGAAGLNHFFGVSVPYIAILLFLFGVVFRVLKWASSPVPFRIPTTAGQEKSLPWIKHAKLDNPSTKRETVVRMLLEVLLFRSLFRNTKFEIKRTQAFLPVGKMALAGLDHLPLLLFGHPHKASALFHPACAFFRARP